MDARMDSRPARMAQVRAKPSSVPSAPMSRPCAAKTAATDAGRAPRAASTPISRERRMTAEKRVLPMEKEATSVMMNIRKKSIVFSKRMASRKSRLSWVQGMKRAPATEASRRAAAASAAAGEASRRRRVTPWARPPIAQSSWKRRSGSRAARSSTSVKPVRTSAATSSSAGRTARPRSAPSAMAGAQRSTRSPTPTPSCRARPAPSATRPSSTAARSPATT